MRGLPKYSTALIFRIALCVAVLSLSLAFLLLPFHGVNGQETSESNSEATIAALQTQVSQLETVVATSSPTVISPTATLVSFNGEPVASSNGVDVLYYYFVDNLVWDQYPIILGELRNETDTPMSVGMLGVSIALLDIEGNLVDEIPCEVASTIIPPHDTVPFVGSWVNSQNHPDMGDWATEQVSINVIGPSDASGSSLAVTDVKELSMTASKFSVSGWIENLGSSPSGDFIEVIAAGYDSTGRFVGFNWGQITTSIPAGKKAKFTIDSWTNPAFDGLSLSTDPDHFTYRIFVRQL